MLIRHLSFFVALAEEKHFARAAQMCNVTQPTLSAAIRKLEEDLDATLIIRGHRFMGLTPDGERVLEWGRQILLDYDSLRQDLVRSASGMRGRLRLGVIPTAMPVVGSLSQQLMKAHPEITVDIRSMTSVAIQNALDIFEIDCGLTYLENEPLEHVQRVPLYEERYVFVCSRNHRQAQRARLSWREVVNEPLCLLGEDMQNRRILAMVARSAELTLEPSVVANSFLAICSHVRSGSWCSVLPHSFTYMFGDAPDLRSLPLIDPDERQTIGLVVSDRSPQSPMAHAVVRCAKGLQLDHELGGVLTVA